MRTKSSHHVQLGPSIPIVPIGDFSKLHLTREQWVDVWRIIGPTVDRNLSKSELWMIFAVCYLQGLNHGAGIMADRRPVPDFYTLWDQLDAHADN